MVVQCWGSIIHFNFSIDGYNAELHDQMVGFSGAFEQLKKGIASLRKAIKHSDKVTLAINTVVIKYNVNYLDKILNLSSELGAYRLTLLRFHGYKRKEQLGLNSEMRQIYEFDILPNLISHGQALGVEIVPVGYVLNPDNTVEIVPDDILHKIPCFSAWFSAAIFPSGEVYVCCHARNQLLCYGNIKEMTLEEMLKGNSGNKIRTLCHTPVHYVPECSDCDLFLMQRLKLAQELGFIPKEMFLNY